MLKKVVNGKQTYSEAVLRSRHSLANTKPYVVVRKSLSQSRSLQETIIRNWFYFSFKIYWKTWIARSLAIYQVIAGCIFAGDLHMLMFLFVPFQTNQHHRSLCKWNCYNAISLEHIFVLCNENNRISRQRLQNESSFWL